MSAKGFFVLGNNILDTVFRVPSWERDSKISASACEIYAGGQAANTAWTLATLGQHVKFCGRFGIDGDGLVTLDSLRSIGIDLTPSLFGKRGRTARAMIIVDEALKDRTIVMHFDQELAEQPLEPKPQDFEGVDCFYWDGYEAQTAARCIELCRRNNILTCGNIETFQSDLTTLVDRLDIVVMPKQVYCREFGEGTDCARLRSGSLPRGWTDKTVVLTSGAEGSIGTQGQIVVCAPAEKVDVVDSTGAGDAFSAGLVLRLAQGADLASSIAFASRLGALACETRGPRAEATRLHCLTN